MQLNEFLSAVITSPEGYLCLALRTDSFVEQWFTWPSESDAVADFVNDNRSTGDVYFSPYLFNTMRSLKANAIPGRTIVADLDEADVDRLVLVPSYLVRTSTGRHQGYWLLEHESTVHEQLSKNLTYSIPRCDPSGWCLGHRFRLPGTLNYKYTPAQSVEVVLETGKRYTEDMFTLLPEVSKDDEVDTDWLNAPIVLPDVGPLELLESVRGSLPLRTYLGYKAVAVDRSEALWALMCALFRAGLTREQVYLLAYHSPNNKFSKQRYNGDRDLAKDVLRAERAVQSKQGSAREHMEELRHGGGIASDKRQLMAALALSDLQARGRFIHTTSDELWYVLSAQGRPIPILRSSDYLDMLLDVNYGLNSSEGESRYVVASLASHTRSKAATVERGVLSYYKDDVLLLHCGGSNILRISPNSIERVPNGSIDVMFPWILANEPFMPLGGLDTHWSNVLFNGALDTIIDTDRNDAKALLTCWFIFLLLREAVTTLPIIAFFGQPGAGKSTLFKRIYRLLYGTRKSLNAVTTPDDYDHAVSNDPLVVLDNVDTWERWLPDRLALSAARSEATKRKLFTDTDTITIRRQALVGLTAHNPKFGREDVVDRLLILTFERLSKFRPEAEILDTITKLRPQLWYSIVTDVQQVLREPWPAEGEAPQFRIEDFARLGYRIAKALHIEDAFARSLTKIRADQRQFNLGEDDILVNAIRAMVSRPKYQATYESPATLWATLQALSTDARTFEVMYKNSNFLGKKLWAMQDSLSAEFAIDWQQGLAGARKWRFMRLD